MPPWQSPTLHCQPVDHSQTTLRAGGAEGAAQRGPRWSGRWSAAVVGCAEAWRAGGGRCAAPCGWAVDGGSAGLLYFGCSRRRRQPMRAASSWSPHTRPIVPRLERNICGHVLCTFLFNLGLFRRAATAVCGSRRTREGRPRDGADGVAEQRHRRFACTHGLRTDESRGGALAAHAARVQCFLGGVGGLLQPAYCQARAGARGRARGMEGQQRLAGNSSKTSRTSSHQQISTITPPRCHCPSQNRPPCPRLPSSPRQSCRQTLERWAKPVPTPSARVPTGFT